MNNAVSTLKRIVYLELKINEINGVNGINEE